MNYPTTTTAPTEEQAEAFLAEARRIAAANYRILVEELGTISLMPTTSANQKLAYADHFFKASGLAAKKEAEEQGSRVVVNINFGTNSVSIKDVVEVTDPVIEVAKEAVDLLGDKPTYLNALTDTANNLEDLGVDLG